MDIVWVVVPVLLGAVLGLFFGRLLSAIIVYWEGSDSAVKSSIAVVVFVLGGGSGAVIFAVLDKPDSTGLYLLGLALAGIYVFFRPRIPPRYTRETIEHILILNSGMPGLPLAKRITLILATLTPAKLIEREEGIKENEWAEELEEATDMAGAIAEDDAPYGDG